MPTDTASSESSGGGTPSQPSPSRMSAFAVLEALSRWLEALRKVFISLAVVIGIIVATLLIGREICEEGIIIDPVIVQLNDIKEPLTPELAALHIAKHISTIQRSGVHEWSKLYVDQSPNPIDLQIPGAPFSLRTGMREVAALLGIKRQTIRASVVGRRVSPALAATVSIAGDPAAQASCEEYADANGMDRLLECIALNAMTFIDPKVAASYVFDSEVKNCNDLDADQPPGPTAIAKEHRRVLNRRARCGFPRTQALIAKVLERGRAEDLPWVPYVYGKVHLARANALSGIDQAQQLGELDQAIGRFADTNGQLPNSTSAIAILFEAHVKKGIAIHEATPKLEWSNDPASPLQWQFFLAESTFGDAILQLRKLPTRRSQELDTLIQRLEGALYYRQWMIKAHRRTRSAALVTAVGHADEVELLTLAEARYAAAARYSKTTSLFMDWGNALRALGKFDDAAKTYLRAADLSPDWYAPRLNLAFAYLDRVEYGTTPADSLQVLVALGASSNYLAWVSGGDPFPNFLSKIERAVRRTGVSDDLDKFKSCRPSPQGNSTDEKMAYVAAAKVCIDQTIEQVGGRVMNAPRAPVTPASQKK
jgi:tetratricopeptide (TPR) repeat protein